MKPESDQMAAAILAAVEQVIDRRLSFFLATVTEDNGKTTKVRRLDAATADAKRYAKVLGNLKNESLPAGAVVLMGGLTNTMPVVLGRVINDSTVLPAALTGDPDTIPSFAFSGRQNVDGTHPALLHVVIPENTVKAELYLYGLLPAPYREHGHTHVATFTGSGHTHPTVSSGITVTGSATSGGSVVVDTAAPESEERPAGVEIAINAHVVTANLGGPFGDATVDWGAGPLDLSPYLSVGIPNSIQIATTGSGLMEWLIYLYPPAPVVPVT